MAVSTMNDIAHHEAAPTSLPSLGRPKITTGVFWVLWAALLLWASHALATAWPYVGLMPQWLLLVAVANQQYNRNPVTLWAWARRNSARLGRARSVSIRR